MSRKALIFECAGDSLLGILDVPEAAAQLGVLIVVGGPQYRIGSHRQFVHLARALSSAGYATFRFDVRGMGDSDGARRSFKLIDDDIAAALDTFMAQAPSLRGIVIWGLCDGASAALLYAARRQDPRVVGLALANPWTRSPATQAATRVKHYYVARLLSGEFWSKLVRGRVGLAAVRESWSSLVVMLRATLWPRSVSLAAEQTLGQSLMAAWAGFQGRMLLLLSDNDYTAKEFLETARGCPGGASLLATPRVVRVDIQGADHTFSDLASQALVEAATQEWLLGLSPTGLAASSGTRI
jgi:exosortase A-associated hydrolase 1